MLESFPSSKQSSLNTHQNEINNLLNYWIHTIVHGTVDEILTLYHPDAVLHPTISAVVSDTEEKRRAYFTQLKAQGKIKVSVQESNVRIYHNTAISSGIYIFHFLKDGKTRELPARFSFTYLKTEKGWKIVEHHSSSLPESNSLLD